MSHKLLACLLATLTAISTYADEWDRQGYYIGAFGGANFMEYNASGGLTIDTKVGYVVGICGGYKFCNGISLEAEGAYRHNDIEAMKFENIDLGLHGNTEVTTVMVNAIYEIPIGNLRNCCCFRWNPYVGAGIGYSYTDEHASNNEVLITGNHNSFAWQAMAGISFPFCSCADLGVEYRYLHPNCHIKNDHAAIVSLKRYF